MSILSPGHRPAEPLAEVLTLEATPVAARSTASEFAGQVFYDKPGTLIRRDCGVILAVR